ncbi:mechanosensitive ion channel [Bacteriovoracaceae bacterium]|nr:mechanosensitive ion channel [Bacteriovoracaceae bacterium]MDC1174870.1 mechanosensitive ion channel [Bacteriovoracaceae bacterium]
MNINEFWPYLKKAWYYLSLPLFEISGSKISVLSIFTAGLIFYGAVILSKMGERFVQKVLNDKPLERGVKGSIERITRYLILIIGALITLDTVGISMSSLAAVGAVFMVGIGFGLQNITSNFISGLIILLERPIRVGDLVEVKGVEGKVIDIRARSTIIHTREDIAIIVPNSQFISEQVINGSFSGENVRLSIEVGVSYNSNPRQIEEILLDMANNSSDVIKFPKADVIFHGFGDSSLNFILRVWVKDQWRNEKIMSDLRFNIFESFAQKGVEIPFPQRVVHQHIAKE